MLGGKYQHGWGALLYKMGKIAHASHNTKHNHNTHNNHYKQLMLYSPAAMLLSLHGQGKMHPNHSATAPLRVCAGLEPSGWRLPTLNHLFRATKCHPSKERERDGAQALGGCHSMDQHNNQLKVGGNEG